MIFAFEDLKNLYNLYDEYETIKNSDSKRIVVSPYVNELKMMSVYHTKLTHTKKEPFVTYDNKRYDLQFVDCTELKDGDRYIIGVGVSQSPSDWMSDHYPDNKHNFINLFQRIRKNKRYLKDLQEKNAYLLIDNSLEGYHSDDIFDYLYDGAIFNRIPPSQIIYVTGNLLIEDNLKEWIYVNTGKEPIQVIPYAHFEFDIGYKVYEMTKYDSYELPTMKSHFEYKEVMGVGCRLYNFLNKKPRGHRMWMFNSLRKWNMIDNGIVASNKYEYDSLKIDFNECEPDELDECNKLLPLFPFDDDLNDKEFNYYMYNFNIKACLESWISIISETHFEDKQKNLFISEKTFKTIACMSPFMILGNKHSLRELKKLGYYTFDGLVKETYDNLDSIHRINAIIDELRNFQQNKKKMTHLKWFQPILEHNVNVLKNNALFVAPPKFKQLYSQINEL